MDATRINQAADADPAKLKEGKAKIISHAEAPGEIYLRFKDVATAFNGEKFAEIPGKGKLNAEISARLFELLESYGLPTMFLAHEGDALIKARHLTMISLEVVVRNQAYGSLCKRYGLQEGQPLSRPVVEFFLKDDHLGDPAIGEDMILARGLLPEGVPLDLLKRRAMQVNEILVHYFNHLGIHCADFKLEFGLDAEGALRLGDELSPDNFRLREHGSGRVLDKDVFRLDQGDLIETYAHLLERIRQAESLVMPHGHTYRAQVFVHSRKGILNPQSRAITASLQQQGFEAVETLRAGKHFELTLQAPTMIQAELTVRKMAEAILSNPVIEDIELAVGMNLQPEQSQ